MLQVICGGVAVNRKTGEVFFTPYDYTSVECKCLRALVESKYTVRIHSLPSPDSHVPDSRATSRGPDKTIGSCNGGATVTSSLSNASMDGRGNPGSGTGADIYIDTSNNHEAGYNTNSGGSQKKAPLSLILAHELSSGHAFQSITGTLPHPTDDSEVDEANRENAAIDCENRGWRRDHRAEGWRGRSFLRVPERQ